MPMSTPVNVKKLHAKVDNREYADLASFIKEYHAKDREKVNDTDVQRAMLRMARFYKDKYLETEEEIRKAFTDAEKELKDVINGEYDG